MGNITIRKGSKGLDVSLCQHLLTKKGIQTSADSDYGPSTERKVKEFQKINGLVSDGIVGEKSWNSLLKFADDKKHIVHNGKILPIKWDKVVLWTESDGLIIKSGKYYNNDYIKKDRTPTMFVNHWDVCLSAESCASVLNRRNVSVHFCLDNDGTIYQLLDIQHGAWHCGNRSGNKNGIGVEISNAYYLKYQTRYEKEGFGSRPIQNNGVVHGRTLDPFTWFYPAQIEALKSLWAAVSDGVGIPLTFPKNDDGSANTSVHEACVNGKFEGFCNHYNFTNRKIDCAGLDMQKLLKEAEGCCC